ncbi:MFS transporter [Modestobacter sp. I12A-02628]|uniref:MFS transporter n=2 Tax=Goekera deserti TaxID=2497753 RepID=A0A7K3WGX7_9ACTN|nr:MFS transporter [Goekera deserti]NDI48914.1 MFS transporter [Goekera deserti]NEL55616.1 MFS transporter [Goekera deserti]
MVTAVLPLYLTMALGLSPLAFGVLDGLYQGVTVLVRLLGGYVADRFARPKVTAQVGYGLSAVCKLGLLAVSSPTGIGAVLAVDRTGKGLRTAPRDALIAAAVPEELLGRAFGVHRAMDTAGALLGPLVAFALLLYLPDDYDSVFLTSAAFAAAGCTVLWAFVRERPAVAGAVAVRLRSLAGLVRDVSLRRVALAALALGALTVSDGFLYLLLRDRDAVSATAFPLLFVGTAVAYLVLAVPLGRLADRVGRVPVLVGGHGALLLCYAALRWGAGLPGPALLVLVLGALGVYYAATDGVLAALAASLTPAPLRGSGIALVQTALAAGRLVSAVLFGLLWSALDQDTAMTVFVAALVAGLPVTWRLLRDAENGTRRAPVASGG